MIDSTANTIVIVMFGVGTGLVVGTMSAIKAANRGELAQLSVQEYWKRSGELNARVKAIPLYRQLSAALGLLIIFAAVSILVTPAEMEWGPYLLSAVAAWFGAYSVFLRARSRRVSAANIH
jgi:hypothetical protein